MAAKTETAKTSPQRRQGPQGPGMAMSTEKAKDFKKSIKRLFIHIKPFYIIISVALIFAVASTIFSIYGPMLIKDMYEIIMKNSYGLPFDSNGFVTIGTWLIILYIISAIFTYFQGFIMSTVTARMSRKMRTDISRKINRLPLNYFDKQSYGDVLSRITNDVDTIGSNLGQGMTNIITSITMLIGIIIMMFTISWELTLIVIASVPTSMILIMIVVKFSQKYFVKQQDILGDINGHIEEVYSAHNIVKVFNGEKKITEEFDEMNNNLYRNSYKSQFLSGLMFPIMNFIGNLTYLLVCAVGGGMAISSGNQLFIASIVTFITYVKQFNQPISQLATIASSLQTTAAAAERVFEFLDEEEQIDENRCTSMLYSKYIALKDSETNNEELNKEKIFLELNDVKGKVEFKDVCFGYTDKKEIIHNFSCVAQPGQKIAIVGPTGAGKTTLVNLLMRFYEINSGEILIDDISTKDMKRNYVRSLFGMVLQDTWLFEGTIKENLKFGNPDATDEEVMKACESANVDHFIKTLSHGYDMIITEQTSLSQGEKQLLTIARAMVQNAPMLILDEATSSVDTRTEELIQKAMDKLMEGRTSFVIAHRLSTIKNSDLILVMKEGEIIEMGNHEELIELNGFYADLYNSQFSD